MVLHVLDWKADAGGDFFRSLNGMARRIVSGSMA